MDVLYGWHKQYNGLRPSLNSEIIMRKDTLTYVVRLNIIHLNPLRHSNVYMCLNIYRSNHIYFYALGTFIVLWQKSNLHTCWRLFHAQNGSHISSVVERAIETTWTNQEMEIYNKTKLPYHTQAIINGNCSVNVYVSMWMGNNSYMAYNSKGNAA